MIVQVDWYKETGKWYAGGEVNIGDVNSWDDRSAIMLAIVKNQKELSHGSRFSDFYVVVSDLPESHSDRNYHQMFNRLYKPEDFT